MHARTPPKPVASAALLTLVVLAACESAAEPDTAPSAVAMELHAGDGQVAPAGSPVDVAPQVRVIDDTGGGASGVAVSFRVAEGGGSVETAAAVSDPAGVASAGRWTMGVPGRQRLEASAPGLGVVAFEAGASGTAAALEIVAGNHATIQVASAARVPPTVAVVDEGGRPAPYVPVTFAAEHGSVATPRVFTDDGGRASPGSWTLGTIAGPQRLVAAVAGSGIDGNPALFEATATPAQPGQITVSPGEAPPEISRPYLPPPTVRVTDAYGNGVPHVAVGFRVDGGGRAPSGIVYTGSDGTAPASLWRMGPEIGAPNTLTATVLSVGYDLTGASATLTVAPQAADFDLWVVPQAAPTIDPAVLAALESAKRRWEQAVTGDLPPFATSLNNVDWCNPDRDVVRFDLPNVIPYDDLLVLAVVAEIDGPGGAASRSGWCWGANRDGVPLPTVSVLQIDDDDVTALVRDGLLEALAMREMGHALGFGASEVWERANLIGRDEAGPYFRGSRARAAFVAAGGAYPGPAVPLDSIAGPTAWRWQERLLGPELMTATLLPGVLNPLSAVTLGALADMGYSVNVAAADRYVAPQLGSARGVRLPSRRPQWTRRIVNAQGDVVAVFPTKEPP